MTVISEWGMLAGPWRKFLYGARKGNAVTLSKTLARLRRDENAATAIEYALIAALIFVVIVSAVNLLSRDMSDMYNEISNAVTSNT